MGVNPEVGKVSAREIVLHRFRYHAPTPETVALHEPLRACFIEAANVIMDLTPPGRHQSLALTALQEALMWGNAAIACDTVT